MSYYSFDMNQIYPQQKEHLLKLFNTFPGLSFTSESQNISLRSTSLITCILSSTMSLQVVSRSQVSSISFHSLSIHCLYHRSSQSHTNGLPRLYNVNFNLAVCIKIPIITHIAQFHLQYNFQNQMWLEIFLRMNQVSYKTLILSLLML